MVYLFLHEFAAERILTEAASVSRTACLTAPIKFSAHPTSVSVASMSALGSKKKEMLLHEKRRFANDL